MTSVIVESDGTDEPPPAGMEGLAVTGEEPVGPAEVDCTVVVSTAGEVSATGEVSAAEEVSPAEVVSVTGHTVVLIATVEVTTLVESAGQLVTVGAQLVIVISLVE